MKSTVIRHANAMCAPTWHRLAVNHADIAVPCQDAPTHDVVIDAHGFLADAPADAFDAATVDLQHRMGDEGRARFEHDHTRGFDVCALSEYQKNLVEREREGDFAASFATGAGPAATKAVEALAQTRRVLACAPGEKGAHATVYLDASDAAACVCALDIVLAPDSQADVEIVFNGADARDAFLASNVRIFCGARSTLRLASVQAAGPHVTLVDDAGCLLDEDACIDIAHFSLTQGTAFTGFACDLRGERSTAQARLRYLGRRDAELDFNYIFNHHGARSESALEANGVLAGSSTKTLKATIDFVRGCKGAQGHEHETALIASEQAHNRSCPVILCGEDDVAGEHGASIGHIDARQMFYLASRGLSAEASEALFCRSVARSAHEACIDTRAKNAVERIASDMLAFDKEETR